MHLRGAQTGEVYIAAQASLDAREGGGGGECDRLQLPGAVSEQKPSARVAAFFIIVDDRELGAQRSSERARARSVLEKVVCGAQEHTHLDKAARHPSLECREVRPGNILEFEC